MSLLLFSIAVKGETLYLWLTHLTSILKSSFSDNPEIPAATRFFTFTALPLLACKRSSKQEGQEVLATSWVILAQPGVHPG